MKIADLINSETSSINKSKFLIIVFLGVILRLLAMTQGKNFDFDSFKIVGEIVNNGGNVYAETYRYNYAPVFSILLGSFYYISSFFENQIYAYRILIVCFLTCFDIALALLLYKKYKKMSIAALFLLNPVSIIITGFHNQFDNVAVFIGYLGCLLINDKNESFTKKDIVPVLLLSLSLITKHLLFIFPLWILFNQNLPKRKKIIYAVIPVMLFLLSFVPYLHNGYEGIIKNVFLYQSKNNFPLIHIFFKGLHIESSYIFCFIILMVLLGYLTRKKRFEEQILFYFLGLVCFTSGMANQYLAVPVISICIFGGFLKYFYFTLTGLYLILDSDGFNLRSLFSNNEVVSWFMKDAGFAIAAWTIFIIILYRLLNPIRYDELINK
ncbi:MAG: hypothetical protein PHD97_02190 [Bacteroidales bacterium]|nr:hypothetical protein [Bacteroidales bacterium]